jgi:protein arginine N-methyltransferase 1
LGLIALKAGAGKVIFVEEEPIIKVARRTVFEAGFSDRAEFIQKNSYQLELRESVDVVVCDHVGYFGFDYGILALLADAKQRFLKPDGIVVPTQIDLFLAPVQTEEGRKIVSRWKDGSIPPEFSWVGAADANAKHALELGADGLLADAGAWANLTLGEEPREFIKRQVELTFDRDGQLDGLLGWFECLLHDGVSMTNSPSVQDRLERPQAFLPFEEPVSVRKVERLFATIMIRPADHIIAWSVELPDQGKTISLSTFKGLLLDKESLNRTRPDRLASLNDRGRAYQIVLSYCDGTRTVAEVEALVHEQHPDLLPSPRARERLIRQVLGWSID